MHQLTNKQWEAWEPQYKVVPLMRIVISLCIGIFVSGYFGIYVNLIIPIILVFILIGIITYLKRNRIDQAFKVLHGALLMPFFVLVGFQLIYSGRTDFNRNYFSKYWQGKRVVVLKILDIPKNKSTHSITRARVMAVNGRSDVSGELYVLIKTDEIGNRISVNDIVYANLQLAKPLDPINPNQFNFKKYLFNKHLYHEVFIRKENFIKVEKDLQPDVYEYIKAKREEIIKYVKGYGFNPVEFSVANSLLFGYTGDLTQELSEQYSNTGVMHILSVSGLHVGIIYLVLNFFIQVFDKTMTTRIRHFIIISSILWFYAMLSGMSPSIVRSAFMFSMLKLSESLNNRAGSFHTFYACLFALLLYDAYYLFDVGFQLSFLAVYGILYFQNKFKRWFKFENKYFSKAFDLVSVTIAAQITTIPISLFYFHQFPSYFIVSNFIVIPISSLVMLIGLVFIIFSTAPYLGKLLYLLFKGSIGFMNSIVEYLDRLPYSSIKNIYFNEIYLLISFVAIVFLILFLERRHLKFLYLTFGCIILILVLDILSENQKKSNKSLVFYSTNEGLVAEYYENRQSVLIYEKQSSTGGTFESTFLQGNRINNRIGKVTYFKLGNKSVGECNSLVIQGKSIFIVDSLVCNASKVAFRKHYDIIYLKYFNSKVNDRVLQYIRFNNVIFDKKLSNKARRIINKHKEFFVGSKIFDLKKESAKFSL